MIVPKIIFLIIINKIRNKIKAVLFYNIIFQQLRFTCINKKLYKDEVESNVKYESNTMKSTITKNHLAKVYLKRVMGDLEIYGISNAEISEAYFQIPILFEIQVPILIEVFSQQLIGYRFIHFDPLNLIVARMKQEEIANLNWIV